MNITILCTDNNHPINQKLNDWVDTNNDKHAIRLVRNQNELSSGDLLFLISCSEIITPKQRQLYQKTLIIHASDLPEGRGWSPHIWQIIEGKSAIVLSLLEAEDSVDTGKIWKKLPVEIPSHALYDEINNIIFDAEINLMDYALIHFNHITPLEQSLTKKPTYYPKRTLADSELNPNKTLEQQFDLLRICDPNRYPAFFYLNGSKYNIYVEKSVDD